MKHVTLLSFLPSPFLLLNILMRKKIRRMFKNNSLELVQRLILQQNSAQSVWYISYLVTYPLFS